MSLPVILVLTFSLICVVLTSVASGLELWSVYTPTGGSTEYQVGLWKACTDTVNATKMCYDMPDAGGNECQGMVTTAKVFSIMTPVFYFFVLIIAFLLFRSKKPVYSGLRIAMLCFSMQALIYNILTWALWVGYGEGPNCGYGNTVGFIVPLQNYGPSFHIDVVASALGFIIPCLAGKIIVDAPAKPVQYLYSAEGPPEMNEMAHYPTDDGYYY